MPKQSRITFAWIASRQMKIATVTTARYIVANAFEKHDVQSGVGFEHSLQMLWFEVVLHLLGELDALLGYGFAPLVANFKRGVILWCLHENGFEHAVLVSLEVFEF